MVREACLVGTGNLPKFAARLASGKHTITLFVSDGHGYNVSAKIRIDVINKGGGPGDDDTGPSDDDIPGDDDGAGGTGDLLSGDGKDSNIWLFIFLGIVLLLIIIIITVILVIRKRKKEEEEIAPKAFPAPQGPAAHPYTQGLLSSIPNIDEEKKRLNTIPGIVPNMFDLPEGCKFAERCPYAKEICWKQEPEGTKRGKRHEVYCFFPLGSEDSHE